MEAKGIVIHCSDSPHRGDTAEDIHRWHLQRGFDGIGYHYVIREDGQVEKGRPDFWNGAHARGCNSTHLGVCLLGIDEFTPEQFDALKDLVIGLMLEYSIDIKNVIGHYMVDSGKTCPNFDVEKFLDDNIDS